MRWFGWFRKKPKIDAPAVKEVLLQHERRRVQEKHVRNRYVARTPVRPLPEPERRRDYDDNSGFLTGLIVGAALSSSERPAADVSANEPSYSGRGGEYGGGGASGSWDSGSSSSDSSSSSSDSSSSSSSRD